MPVIMYDMCSFNSYNLMLNVFLFQLSVMYYNLSIALFFYMHASVILVSIIHLFVEEKCTTGLRLFVTHI